MSTYSIINKDWSYENVKYLLEHIKKDTIDDIRVKKIKKSTRAILDKCKTMGISKIVKPEHPWIFWDRWSDAYRVIIIDDKNAQILDKGTFKTLKDAETCIIEWKILWLT